MNVEKGTAMQKISVENSAGLEFTVILLELNEQGPAGLPCQDGRIVQFYDPRYIDGFTPVGQFVSSYYLDDIMPGYAGVNLNGGVPEWAIDADTMNLVRAWLREWWVQT